MSDKKHIDRLFQERFKDFEATPRDAVWKNIEEQLNLKKKKRRVFPIWWRYAGVAALLVILLTISSLLFNNNPSENIPTNQVVDTKNDVETLDDSNKDNSNTLIDFNKQEDKIKNENEAVAISNIKNPIKKATQNNIENTSDTVVASNETLITENSSSKQENDGAQKTLPPSNKSLSGSNLKTDNKTVIASNSKEKNNEAIQNKNDNPLINTDKPQKITHNISKNNTAIAEVKKDDILTDSIAQTEALVNNNTKENELTIEDAINKTKDIIEEEENLNRWRIAPNAAPVYFSSLGNGSSIDPQFNNNSKSGELNMSYGIKASYAINKKLSVRSGINRVNLGYTTNNVVVFQSISSSSSALQNVNTGDDDANTISVISGENVNPARSPESFTTKSNSSLNQSFGYIEVPLEIQYALINKKFGVNVIGGFSSFFLNKNEIFSDVSGSKTLLGEATNINKVSYSANFGLGLNYKVSKKIDLNFEPVFKYQINTFNNTSGNFKPYFIGVYTGFAIKF